MIGVLSLLQVDLHYEYPAEQLASLMSATVPYHKCLPEMIDYGAHILAHTEDHCKLVSSSGVLRVDLGVEIKPIASDGAAGDVDRMRAIEQQYVAKEKENIGRGWQSTGRGYIVRCFCNEVTSSLDINWFMMVR